MQVETQPASAQIHNTDGIQGAGNGLLERGKALAELPFDGTEAAAVLKMAEGALFAAGNQRGHQIPVTVNLKKALGLHGGPAFRTHQRGKDLVIGLDGLQFLLFEGSAAVSDNAAFSFAYVVIAGKEFQDHILRNQDVPYLDNGAECAAHGTRYSTRPPEERVARNSITESADTAAMLSR